MSRRTMFATLAIYVALLAFLGFQLIDGSKDAPARYQTCASSVHKAPDAPPSTPILTCDNNP